MADLNVLDFILLLKIKAGSGPGNYLSHYHPEMNRDRAVASGIRIQDQPHLNHPSRALGGEPQISACVSIVVQDPCTPIR